MRCFRFLLGSTCSVLLSVGASGLAFPPATYGQPGQEEDEHPGRAEEHRADPCALLPESSGRAEGHEKRCPGGGSSSGIAKGDFNGDGFADLAVGVPDEDVGAVRDAGAVNVIYGSEDGLTTTTTGVPAGQFWHLDRQGVPGSVAIDDRFGAALAAGDFNADGFSDLAVGIPNRDLSFAGKTHRDSGAVVVIYGSSGGLSTGPDAPAAQFINMRTGRLDEFFGTLGGAHFGFSLAWGNFDGDRSNGRDVGDLAIGMPGVDLTAISIFPDPAVDIGGVWVVRGDAARGLDLSFDEEFRGLLISETPGRASQLEEARFGSALAAGDFFGHGVSSLAVGEPGRLLGTFRDGRCVQNCRPQAGMVEVFDSIFSEARRVEFWFQDPRGNGVDLPDTGESDDQFGASLAAGDFDGDGVLDLAIGVPGEQLGTNRRAGAVHVLYSIPGSGLTDRGNQFLQLASFSGSANEAGALFGRALAAGDFNADERSDLAIGIPFKEVPGASDGGQVKVIYGSRSGLSFTLVRDPQTLDHSDFGLTAAPGDAFGASLTAWNFGRNRELGIARPPTADLAIGIPFRSVGGVAGAGAVAVMYGSVLGNGLVISDLNPVWDQNSGVSNAAESGDHFGASLY